MLSESAQLMHHNVTYTQMTKSEFQDKYYTK